MAGFARFLAVLRLYDERADAWTVPAMSEHLGVPASTVYRTVRDLVAGGFLEAGHDSVYRLGPAFIEYDRLLRLTDPLVAAGKAVLRDVVAQARTPCVALLSRLYNDQVMCVVDEAGRDTALRPSYERGRPMPLTQGATSKVILAHLPQRQLNRLIGAPKDQNGRHVALRSELVEIRKRGFCATASEIDAGLAGIAAPVIVREAGVIASLSVVVDDALLDEAQRRRLILLVVSAASLIAEDLRHALRPPAVQDMRQRLVK